MSLYNLLHGKNPHSDVLLAVIDIDQSNARWSSGRFRDIYLNEDGTEIILYTRNGGGNRDGYFPYEIQNHPNYLRDWDDDFDSTYAYIAFSIPEEFKEFCKYLSTGEKPQTVHEKFQATMEEMKGMTKEQLESDERFKPLAEILKQITKEA